MGKRKKKWPKGKKPKLRQGGVINESQKLDNQTLIPAFWSLEGKVVAG